MEIIYLDNSGFAITDGKLFMAIDYCNDRPVKGKQGLEGGVLTDADLAKYETKLVLFSHSHSDHYVKSAFDLKNLDKFIISSEFPKAYEGVRLAPLESYEGEGIKVKAFGSTDIGISFLIDAFGKRIFHAGDFNYWHWKDESTQEEIKEAHDFYLKELEPMLAYAGSIDICFFPVDPRMGEDTMEGPLDFADKMKPKFMIPMHNQSDPQLAYRFVEELKKRNMAGAAIPTRGERFQI